tara:strand:+ start:692 stop:811 length:120 start_codon:yes stop_codon:yes gene_type:complete
MRKPERNHQINPDHYEDILRLEKLDAYEALIRSKFLDNK